MQPVDLSSSNTPPRAKVAWVAAAFAKSTDSGRRSGSRQESPRREGGESYGGAVKIGKDKPKASADQEDPESKASKKRAQTSHKLPIQRKRLMKRILPSLRRGRKG